MYNYKKLLVISCLPMLCSCGIQNKKLSENVNKSFKSGNFCKTAELTTEIKDICNHSLQTENQKKLTKINTLNSLNAGNSLFLSKKYELAGSMYDKADLSIQDKNRDNIAETSAKATTEILVNKSILDFEPMISDDLYLSSYKILTALALQDKELARIEINRGYKKQQNASKKFKKEIENLKKENTQNQKKSASYKEDSQKAYNKVMQDYDKKFGMWKAYKDYMNPYTTYLSGLYFLNNAQGSADLETAHTYMKRVKGMVPNNSFVKSDYSDAKNMVNGKAYKFNKNQYAWVIFENGMESTFKEFKFDFPILIDGKVMIVSFAIPMPKERNSAYNDISVSIKGNKKIINTQELMNVDKAFISEYNKKFPIMLTKAITSTIAKTSAQYLAQKKLGAGGALLGDIYTLTTTAADTRTWNTLPKNVQLAKVKLGKNKNLEIKIKDKVISEVSLPEKGNSIVYVRIPSQKATPVISVFKL